jgi:hypothetical protein
MSYLKPNCQFCFSEEGTTEEVKTNDLESLGGWEVWFCCTACNLAKQPCETFFRIPKPSEGEKLNGSRPQ